MSANNAEAHADSSAFTANFDAAFDDPAPTPNAANFSATFEANFDDNPFDVSDAPAAPSFEASFDSPTAPAPAAEESAEEVARREFEEQRQKRLQQLEQAKQQQQAKPKSSSSSWGGWLSSMPTMMSPSELRTLASERAAAAAEAFQSPEALKAAMTQAATAAHTRAVEKEKELREAMKSGAERLQQQSAAAAESLLSPTASSLLSPVSLSSTISKLDSARGELRRSMPTAAAALDWSSLSSFSTSSAFPDDSGGTPGGADESERAEGDANGDDAGGAPAAEEEKPAKPKKKSYKGLGEVEKFNALMEDGLFDRAIRLAANSPKQLLRATPERALETIKAFQGAVMQPGAAQPPILLYFGALLKHSSEIGEPLMLEEGLELARPVVAQGQLKLLQGWISAGRLRISEPLADIVREKDVNAAIALYKKVQDQAVNREESDGIHSKLIVSYAELGDVDEVCFLCQEKKKRPDWVDLLRQICALPGGIPRAIAFESKLRAMPPPPPPPPEDDELAVMQYKSNPPPPAAPTVQQAVTLFLAANDKECLNHATKLALESLTADGNCLDAKVQTELLVANLKADRGVGDALLESHALPKADPAIVAKTCEGLRMWLQAMRLYPAAADVHRMLCHDGVDDDSANSQVEKMEKKAALEAVAALLKCGTSGCMSKALLIGKAQVERLGHKGLLKAFDAYGSDSAILCYLGARMATPAGQADASTTLAYITAARKAGRG